MRGRPMTPTPAGRGAIRDTAPTVTRHAGSAAAARGMQPLACGGAALGLGAAVLTIGLGASVVCPPAGCQILGIDRTLLDLMNDWQRPSLDALFAMITWLGSLYVLLPLALLLGWRYARRGQRATAILLPLALGGAWLLAHTGKLLIVRPRPELYAPITAMPADFSFPSAHTLQIAAFACAWLLAPGLRSGWHAVVAVVALTLLVALSRVYLQVHYPSDVLFGIVAGACVAAGMRCLVSARA